MRLVCTSCRDDSAHRALVAALFGSHNPRFAGGSGGSNFRRKYAAFSPVIPSGER